MNYSKTQIEFLKTLKHDLHTKCKEGNILRNGECVNGLLEDGNFCQCFKIFRWFKALYGARIPQDYWFVYSDAKIDPAQSVFVYGPLETGKTLYLCDLGKVALLKNWKVVYILLQEYMDHVKERFSSRKVIPSQKYLQRTVDSAKVLLIDDFDKVYIKKGSSFTSKEVESLIRTKITSHITIGISANCTLGLLSNILRNESLVSVIKRKTLQIKLDVKTISSQYLGMDTVFTNGHVNSCADVYHNLYISQFEQKEGSRD